MSFYGDEFGSADGKRQAEEKIAMEKEVLLKCWTNLTRTPHLVRDPASKLSRTGRRSEPERSFELVSSLQP
ncbi:MAG: hypothetical protein IPG67_17060 [Acidobacteria bacterium]|nr:hypothetical protein [Acidobacteriota bacterium]